MTKLHPSRALCSTLAIATALLVGASPAKAQSFQGTVGSSTGIGSIVTGANSTTITVTGQQAVINWTATGVSNGGLTFFQPAGTTATFRGANNFAVLNRVAPTVLGDGIILNGTINSQVGQQVGGTVFFYSPHGVVVGPSGVINVGSLGLTTSPIASDANGNWMTGFGTATSSVAFGNAAAGSFVRTDAGSVINALNQSSYVAMVSPRVAPAGTLNVNGSAALVAAEAATVTFRTSGLFDIQVAAGSDDPFAVQVSGTITGPASSGVGDHHRAYVVAVPKNNAMTLLIRNGSNLGFDVAGAANIVGNAVVLSAGHDVLGDTIQTAPSAGGGSGRADLLVYDTDFTSRVDAAAKNQGLFAADTATAQMASNLTLRAADAQFNALNAGVHQVAGSVTLDTTNRGVGAGPTGGTAFSVATFGGRISIAGDLTLRSEGVGGVAGVTGTGGSAYVLADRGGSLSVGGILRANSDGSGGTGALGRGGIIDVIAGPNSTLAAGSLNASADGFGGADAGAGSGDGFGGSARILATGASASIRIADVSLTGTANQQDLLSAEGFGGTTNGGGTGLGGAGRGGTAAIRAESGGSVSLPNPLNRLVRILGRGTGGNAAATGTTSGEGSGGTVNISVDNGSITSGSLQPSAYGLGGSALGNAAANGGNGIGGTRAISAINSGTLSVGLQGGIAGGLGGNGSGTGRGGNASGGDASLFVDNATVNLASGSNVITQNTGGIGATGGSASGGIATLTVRNGGTVNVANDPLRTIDLVIGTSASGGFVGFNPGSQSGDATGGMTTVSLVGGTINGGRILVDSDGFGSGDGLTLGGAGRGGSATVELNGATINATSLRVSAVGNDAAFTGLGGQGIGGSASLTSIGGTNNVTVGDLTIDASASGGAPTITGGIGGAATGGSAQLAANGGTLTLLGNATLLADALGGDGDAQGGAAVAGSTLIRASAGGDLSISGSAVLNAFGTGGNGHVGGAARGGSTTIESAGAGSTLTVIGQAFSNAYAFAGQGSAFVAGGLGGDAIGGNSSTIASGGALLDLESLFVFNSAFGGDGATGGNSSGGLINFGATGAGSVLDVNFSTSLFNFNNGGTGYGGTGGSGAGGRVDIFANEGSVLLGDVLFAVADGVGGRTEAAGTAGGVGRGGQVYAGAAKGGTLTVLSTASLQANGVGGGNFESNATSGAGFGGIVGLNATGANSTVDARFAVDLSANGFGGFAGGDCTACGGGGGDGTGGTASAGTNGGDGNRILVGERLSIVANGAGSSGHGGAGGHGRGGAASVFLANDGRITVGSGLAIGARGDGGYQSNGGQAGSGTGGDAQVNLAGGPTSLLAVGINAGAEIDRSTTLDANGYGGSAGGIANGIGGAGTGGWSRIYGTGGSADLRGDVRIAAEGQGGNGENGAGGAGIGGRARLNADGAAYRVGGSVAIVTDASGGFGRDGGAASLRAVVDDNNNSGMFANNGGSIVVEGFASLSANARGGAGTNGGHGGAATAGRSSVVASGSATGNGSITLASVTVNANATGGSGAAGNALSGGNGGNATGGLAELVITNSLSGTNRLTVGLADLDASGEGGSGGIGGDGATGLSGGGGGNGSGGTALALTAAGNGALAITDLSLFATGRGGAGGAGGSGREGMGGNGGAGGVGDGGAVIAGMVSGTATATTAGIFNAATLIGWADSYGGTGGDGGSGTSGLGNGGHGGDALHSFNQLIARGGTVTIGDAQLLVDTSGGDGGTGAVAGNGGTAYTPDILVTVTNRFEQPAAGATLDVGDLNFYSFARAGTGAVAGRAIALGGPQLLVENSQARFGNYRATSTAGDGIEPTSLADPIRIINGSVTVERDFLVSTDNRLSVLIDTGSLTAGSVTLAGFTFERDTTVPAPAVLGTIGGGTISILSGQDIVLDANLSSGGALTLDAAGSVAVGTLAATGTSGNVLVSGANVTTGAISAGGAVEVQSGGTLTTAAITARHIVNLTAVGAIATGAVSSQDGEVRIVGGSTIATGNLAAGGGVLLDAGGAIATGTITAQRAQLLALGAIGVGDVTTSEWFDAEAGGALAVGNVTTGEHIALAAQDAVRAGNLSAGLVNAAVSEGADYHIGILSGAAVAVGNAAARDWIGIGARGTLATGTIASGNDVLIAADGAINVGAVTTGAQSRLLIAGADMVALGGPTDAFDRGRVFAALGTPAEAATRGAVTIGGAVSAGRIDALVGGDLTAGALSAGLLGVTVRTGGALATGAVSARTDVGLAAVGAITTGAIASQAGGIRAIGGTSITTGNLAAAGGVLLDAGGSIVAGTIRARWADLFANGDIRVGDATLDEWFDAEAEASLTAGNVTAGERIDTLVGTDFAAGAMAADTVSIIAGRNVTLAATTLRDGAEVDAGGLLTLNGNVVGSAIFTSSDIAVAEGVRIDAAQLISRNAQGTFVGDAIGGEGGYRLSNAEYGRFGSIEITADTALGAGSTMTIGDLLVANAGASEYGFRVGSDADETATGVIRIVGDVRYNGAVAESDTAEGTEVDFDAGRFELDSATGSLALVGAGGGLAGSIDISARHVWVADTAVLARLATDPDYAGLAADLARPSTTRSTEGVIRADTITIALARPAGDGAAAGPVYSVYVQNTGTAAAPAGFAAREAVVETDEANPPAIALNVFGQIVTPSGTLTGVAVRDALMADDNPARFTAGSLINGCALTGACGATADPPFDPQPAISAEIALLATPPADDALFGNEEAIEDNEEEGGDDSASSPISPPAPLFNTKPMEAKSDTDEPVSGSGNPALIGSGRVEGEK